MALLDIVKKGYYSILTESGYVKFLPRTLASLVNTDDGSTVESKITELDSNLLTCTNNLDGLTFKTDLLSVDLNNPNSSLNKVHKVVADDASTLVNSPVASGIFVAKWECIWYEVNRVLVTVTEFYPQHGRVWKNHYNTAGTGWVGWSLGASDTATTLTETLPVSKGGTGATTAKAARTNIGALGSSDVVDNVTSTSTTLPLSAKQGKSLQDQITALNSNLAGKANTSHGNHVPTTQTASNKVFLRNDNTWQTVTPANIGAAASSHTHSYLPLGGGTMTGNINMGGKVVHRTPYLSFGDTSREYGQIKSNSTQTMYIYPSIGETNYGAFCGVRNSTWNFSPITHDHLTLGSSSYKWNCLFANNGTIQTSDRNAKHDIKELTDTHLKFFLKLTPVSFKFNDGTSGRTHIGFISQDVEEAMTECGLTDLDFAGFCKDPKTVLVEKTKTEVKVNPETGEEESVEVEYTEDVPVDGEYVYSLRYDEFIGLVTQATQVALNKIELLEEKIDDLESWKASVEERLSMLES